MFTRQGDMWSMTGKPAVLVDIASATHGRPWELDDRYILALNRTHSDLVKFSKQDEDYEVILHHLQRLSGVAMNVIQDRFRAGNRSSKQLYQQEIENWN